MQLPSIENLRCFDAATKADSFRAAAKAVGLTPTAFGQRIKQLEEQLGIQLFHRTTRSMELTQEGLALVPRVREVLEGLGRFAEVIRGGQPPLMSLVFGTRYELGLSYVLPLHDALVKAHPYLTLHYFFGGSGAELLERVRAREIDLCITSQRITDPLLDSVRMHREDYALVGAAELLERRPFERAEDAAQHVLVDINAALPLFSYWRDSPDGGDRLPFKDLWYVGSIEPMRRVVLEGRVVAVLPRYFVQGDLEAGRLRLILPDVRPLFDYFRLVFRRDDPRRPVFASLGATLHRHPLK